MDANLRRAAEQEMRRPAPDAPPSKRPRNEGKDDAASSFLELRRFNYRAAEQLAQGARGFIITCGFQRGKSATREAIAVLGETTARMSSAAKPAFGIVKLPCLGVVLLTWSAAQDAHPGLPAPSAVVTRLVDDVHSKKLPALKHVQRITPVDGMCRATDAAIRQLTYSLAEEFATARKKVCEQQLLRKEPGDPVAVHRPPLPFAVAFKCRLSEQQDPQAQAGSKGLACGDSSAGSVAVKSMPPQGQGGVQPHEQQGEDDPGDVRTPVHLEQDSSIPPQRDSGTLTKESSRCDEGECGSRGAQEKLQVGQNSPASAAISRGAAIAAVAESFAAACSDAILNTEVNLRQPAAVICLDILPVGSIAIAAVSIVESRTCVLKPKLALKPLQLQGQMQGHK